MEHVCNNLPTRKYPSKERQEFRSECFQISIQSQTCTLLVNDHIQEHCAGMETYLFQNDCAVEAFQAEGSVLVATEYEGPTCHLSAGSCQLCSSKGNH